MKDTKNTVSCSKNEENTKEKEFAEKIYICRAYVYYRDFPSKETGNPIGTLNNGTRVTAIDEKNGWLKLKDLGWSMKEFYEEQE